MRDLNTQAKLAVTELLQNNEDKLYEKIGIISKEIRMYPMVGMSFNPPEIAQQHLTIPHGVRELGMRLFRRWHIEIYKIICGTDPEDKEDRDKLLKAVELDEASFAAVLTAFLVSELGLLPAIAALIATLIVKRFFRPTHQELCQVWREHLPTSGK